MAKITVLGAWAMSSAFSVPCVDNNHETIIVGTHLDNQFIDTTWVTSEDIKFDEIINTNIIK